MRNKIKICFYLHMAYPLFNKSINAAFGGAEVDLYMLSKRFSQETDKYEVTFYVGDYGQKNTEVYDGIKVKKIKYMTVGKEYNLLFKIYRKVTLVYQLLFMDCDIIFTECASVMLGWITFVCKFLRRKKVIFRLALDADADFEYYIGKQPNIYSFYKYGLEHCDTVISQTDRQKNILSQKHNIESIVIKNALFLNSNIDFSNKKYILWVARAVPVKRPELFLELVKRLPQEKFVMIMPSYIDGDDNIVEDSRERSKKIKDMAKGLDNLKFIDYVPFFEIQKYYDNAKLFVNTSELEGFPNAFVQSCIGHTSILSYQVNPDNFIEKNDLGLCCDDSIDEAVKFINSLDDNNLKYYGNNAYKYVEQNHDIDKIFKIYDQICDKLKK